MNRFRVELLEEAHRFLMDFPQKVANKVLYNIRRVADGERNAELLKKLEGTEIWKFRTLYQGNAYRLFAFWDNRTKNLVLATHGLNKKS